MGGHFFCHGHAFFQRHHLSLIRLRGHVFFLICLTHALFHVLQLSDSSRSLLHLLRVNLTLSGAIVSLLGKLPIVKLLRMLLTVLHSLDSRVGLFQFAVQVTDLFFLAPSFSHL